MGTDGGKRTQITQMGADARRWDWCRSAVPVRPFGVRYHDAAFQRDITLPHGEIIHRCTPICTDRGKRTQIA